MCERGLAIVVSYRIGDATFDTVTCEFSTRDRSRLLADTGTWILGRLLDTPGKVVPESDLILGPVTERKRKNLQTAIYRTNLALGRRPAGGRYVQLLGPGYYIRASDVFSGSESAQESPAVALNQSDRSEGEHLQLLDPALAAVAAIKVEALERQKLRIPSAEAIQQLDAVFKKFGTVPYVSPSLRSDAVAELVSRYQSLPSFSDVAAKAGRVLTRGQGQRVRTYPVVAFPAPQGQPLDSLLPLANVDARMSRTIRGDELAIRDPYPRLLRWLAGRPSVDVQAADSETAHGWNLAMETLGRTADGSLVMTARLTEYGLMLDSCDALIDETFGTVSANTSPEAPQWPLRDAVDREPDALLGGAPNPLLRASHRAAGIGIAALIAVVKEEPDGTHRLDALLGRRSKQVGTYPDTWHVAPAGMFNWRFGGRLPNGTDERPWGSYDAGDILGSVLTEYGEETHNLHKLEDNTEREYLATRPAVRRLVKNAEFVFTGVAIDLANLRPEICVLIYVSDPAWHGRQKFKLNYEYVRYGEPVGRSAGKKRTLFGVTVANEHGPIDDALELLDPQETVAAGAAAFWLGVDRARAMFAAELGERPRRQ